MTATLDAQEAVAFARRFGPPVVMAFRGGRCLHPESPTVEAAEAFVAAHADDDLYFAIAATRDGLVGKPTKADCTGSDWAWADLDPPGDETDLAAWRSSQLARADGGATPPPHIAVSSGRGLWLFWRLARRLPPAEVEAINRGVARALDADHCHNVDRVARLPHTRNSKTGEIAHVLVDREGRVEPGDLPHAEEEAAPEVDLPPGRDMAFEELPDRLRIIGMQGRHPDEVKKKDDSRSAWLFHFLCGALRAGASSESILGWLLDESLGISASVYRDRDDRLRPNPAREAERQLESARVEVAQELAREAAERAAREALEQAEAAAVELVPLAPVPADLGPRPWLAEGLLMDGHVTMITGRGGEGKSLLALQIGVMVAARVPHAWWEARERRNVLLLNAEDDLDEQRRRLLAACEVMGADPRLLENRLFALGSKRLELVQRDPEDGAIKTTPLHERLVQLIEQHSIGLVVIDPLVEAHVNLEENSNSDMKELVIKLRALARARRVPILIVHHSRKGSSDDQDAARGASALVNACRVVVTMERMTKDEHDEFRPPLSRERYVRVVGAKANYSGRVGDRWLEIEVVKLGSGDLVAAHRRVAFGELDEGFDPGAWEHHDAFLGLVEVGRDAEGRPWSTADRGPKEARLDAAVADRFGVDVEKAARIIARFELARLISRERVKDTNRNTREVWRLVAAEERQRRIEF